MNNDSRQYKPVWRKWFGRLTCGCFLIPAILVILILIYGLVAPTADDWDRFQGSQAADNYLNSIKADKHIQSWNFTGRTETFYSGDGAGNMGHQVELSGDVTYQNGQHGTLTMILIYNYPYSSKQEWWVSKVDYGSSRDVTPTSIPAF